MATLPFELAGEAYFYEDLSKGKGRTRRVAGVISTETRDRQNEIVIQKGLNFDPFLQYGFLNDDHSKDTDGIVGWPESVQLFQKGDKLPNGMIAKSNCSWLDGYLFEGEGNTRADRIWGTAQAINKSGSPRSLGFSLQGSVLKRSGPGRKVVAEAVVSHCAVTSVPVNTETKLEALAKSLTLIPQFPDDLDKLLEIQKALTMGNSPNPIAHGKDAGPIQGEGAGQILAGQSLEHDKTKKKKLRKDEARELLKARLPHFRGDQIERLLEAAIKMEQAGRPRS
jgi:hypothetical protein